MLISEDQTAIPNTEDAADLAAFEADLDKVTEALEQALETSEPNFDGFYALLRQTCLPFVPIDHRHRPARVFARAASIVERLGSLSPAVALAIENHLYVLSAIATLPTAPGDPMAKRREGLLERIRRQRWLVANTNSRVHGDQIQKTGTVAKKIAGGFRVDGRAVYMSLAGQGDLIVFVTFFETGEPAIFACAKEDHPHLVVGDLLFADAMRDSDTRSVSFNGLEVGEEHLLASGLETSNILQIISYELIWHQSLLAALSLGTTDRAIREGREFLLQTRGPDGQPLARLDGMVVEIGRQVLRLHAARGAVQAAGRQLALVAEKPLEASSSSLAFELACAAKYAATACAEEVVGVIRRLIGARSMASGHVMERLSKEVIFAQLGGEVHAFIERRAGERALALPKEAAPKVRSRALANVRRLAQKRKAHLESSVSKST